MTEAHNMKTPADDWPMILGEIGRGDNRPHEFAWALAQKPGPVFLRSGGGSVIDGLTMAQQLHRAERTVCADYAGSVAALILVAGKRRKLASNGWIFLHGSWSMSTGTAAVLRRYAEHLAGIDAAIVEWLVRHTHIDAATAATWCEGEVYLSAAEALELAMIDEIGPASKIPPRRTQGEALAIFEGQRKNAGEFARAMPERCDKQAEQIGQALASYTDAPAFDRMIADGRPPSWPATRQTIAAAADLHEWTRGHILNHKHLDRPLPETPWPGRWQCADCAEFNYQAPHRDDSPAECIYCRSEKS